MPESNRRHQAPEACALSAELIALKNLVFVVFLEFVGFIGLKHNKPNKLNELNKLNKLLIAFFVKRDLTRPNTCKTCVA